MSVLSETFDGVDREIKVLETGLTSDAAPDVRVTVDHGIALVKTMLRTYLADRNRDGIHASGAASEQATDVASAQSEDVLEVFRAFVKGDPSLNAIRDNIRELVYYQNCLATQRDDALPRNPTHMAVRTLRHIYLYLRTRCLKEQRL